MRRVQAKCSFNFQKQEHTSCGFGGPVTVHVGQKALTAFMRHDNADLEEGPYFNIEVTKIAKASCEGDYEVDFRYVDYPQLAPELGLSICWVIPVK